MPDRDEFIEGVDLKEVSKWMSGRSLGSGSLEEVRPMGGGSQNILVEMTLDDRKVVLRRPPLHRRKGSDEGIMREAHVLRALGKTDVPHPRLIAVCDDPSVTGAAFLIMERVEGVALSEAVKFGERRSATEAVDIGLALSDGAGELAMVHPEEIGLGGLGRREGWMEHQEGRWRSQLDSYSQLVGYSGPGDLGPVNEVGSWLKQHQPPECQVGLIHGDFHFGNVLFTRERPKLAAIVDWELATFGDPLLDLAHLFATWPDGREVESVTEIWPSLPSRDQLLDRYVSVTGRDVTWFPWYRVLACYRLGIILEGTKARADAGQAPADTGARLHAVATSLFRQASRMMAD